MNDLTQLFGWRVAQRTPVIAHSDCTVSKVTSQSGSKRVQYNDSVNSCYCSINS